MCTIGAFYSLHLHNEPPGRTYKNTEVNTRQLTASVTGALNPSGTVGFLLGKSRSTEAQDNTVKNVLISSMYSTNYPSDCTPMDSQPHTGSSSRRKN